MSLSRPLLDLAREVKATPEGVVDLRTLKVHVANLPDFIVVSDDAYEELDTVSAIAFHLRMAFSFFWINRKYKTEPKAPKAAQSGLDLLADLGL